MCDVLTWDILCTCWSWRTYASRIVSECHIQATYKASDIGCTCWSLYGRHMLQDCFSWHTHCHGNWYGCTCYKRKLDYAGFFQMSDPMSWHLVHRTFSMNVWCFVIAQLVAIIGWLKIWLAGAIYQGYQPDLFIFQGDLYSWYEKI